MTEHLNPCTRCNGSGTEPGEISVALDDLARAANAITAGAASDRELARQGKDLLTAIEVYRGACAARITSLEAALRDILGRFPERRAQQGTHQLLQVPNEDVTNWRKVLDGEPGIVWEHVYRDGALVMTRPKMPAADPEPRPGR